MKLKRKSTILMIFLTALLVSCGGGGGGGNSSNSTPTPVGHTLIKINSNRLNTPESPRIENENRISDNNTNRLLTTINFISSTIASGTTDRIIDSGEVGEYGGLNAGTTVKVKEGGVALAYNEGETSLNSLTPLSEQV
jgi:lipoprotein